MILQHRSFLILILFTLMSACVSVNVRPPASKRAADLQFVDPAKPFKKQSNDNADNVWQSQKTGNTIAVISECKTPIEVPLQSLENDTIYAMTDAKILNTSEITYNDRAAIETTASGLMDGIDIQMKVVTFKKNSCNFILTYVGRSKNFVPEESVFENFLKGFIAP